MFHWSARGRSLIVLFAGLGLVGPILLPVYSRASASPSSDPSRVSSASIDAQNPVLGWARRLQSRFGSVYGGYAIGPNGVVVYETSSDPSFQAAAAATIPPTSQATTPTVTFQSVPVSWTDLDNSRARLTSSLFADESSTVFGVGMNELTGQVVVFATDPTAANASIRRASPNTQTSIVKGDRPTPSSNRFSDSPPWNGGDRITRGTAACTSGFGVHNGSGAKYLSTAGHCFGGTWYNGSSVIGNTAADNIGSLDGQMIATNSSCIAWGGSSTSPTRWFMTGWNTPGAGTVVYEEGSFSFEHAVTITAANVSSDVSGPGYSEHVTDGFTFAPVTQPGDSGGPVVQPSIYGPLAAGDIISRNSSVAFAQYFAADLYSYGLAMNTARTQSYC